MELVSRPMGRGDGKDCPALTGEKDEMAELNEFGRNGRCAHIRNFRTFLGLQFNVINQILRKERRCEARTEEESGH